MRSMSQTTITILRDEITEYRRGKRLSRETVAAGIVDAHERLGADVVTGIRFEPKTVDAFERTKVNADRIFRWLDDVTKDGVFVACELSGFCAGWSARGCSSSRSGSDAAAARVRCPIPWRQPERCGRVCQHGRHAGPGAKRGSSSDHQPAGNRRPRSPARRQTRDGRGRRRRRRTCSRIWMRRSRRARNA